MKLDLYTDGSSIGKKGPGGWAFQLFKDGTLVVEEYGGEDNTTNNRMELMGVIRGLEYVYEQGYSGNYSLEVYSDSQYVVKGINEWYPAWEIKIAKGKEIKNQDLWLQLKSLVDLFPTLILTWVRGHVGIQGNEACDILAKKGKEEIKKKHGN